VGCRLPHYHRWEATRHLRTGRIYGKAVGVAAIPIATCAPAMCRYTGKTQGGAPVALGRSGRAAHVCGSSETSAATRRLPPSHTSRRRSAPGPQTAQWRRSRHSRRSEHCPRPSLRQSIRAPAPGGQRRRQARIPRIHLPESPYLLRTNPHPQDRRARCLTRRSIGEPAPASEKTDLCAGARS
jgi:hypothetical protein